MRVGEVTRGEWEWEEEEEGEECPLSAKRARR